VEVPPAVVVDAHDVCTDLDQAQASLREALGGSVAPAAGWKLRVYDERRGKHVIVTANLDDADGNAVAHRELEANSSDRCSGVLSALAVWAALTLDAEVTRARAHPPTAKSSASGAPGAAKAAALPSGKGPGEDAPSIAPSADSDAGAPQAKPPKALEIGGSASLMNSPLTNLDAALVGGDIFVLAEVLRSLLLRPSLLAGASIGPTATYFGTRLDACLRVPGNYTEHRGLLLDICGGTEFAAIDHNEYVQPGDPQMVHRTDALLAFGPSLALRGDLASDLSVEVRGLAGFNVVHTDDTIALLSLRAQVGVTWRLR
jgi:hypothetical protein